MKLNKELIKRLTDGEIAYKHTGNMNQFNFVMSAVVGKDVSCPDDFKDPFFIHPSYPNTWLYYIGAETKRQPNLPIFTTEQFFEVETERDWHNERPTAILSVATAQPQAKKFRLFWGLLEFEY